MDSIMRYRTAAIGDSDVDFCSIAETANPNDQCRWRGILGRAMDFWTNRCSNCVHACFYPNVVLAEECENISPKF